jgi:hypothetical protein
MSARALVFCKWDEVQQGMADGRRFRRFAWKAEGFLCLAQIHVVGREQPVATVLWRTDSHFLNGYQYHPVARDKETADWFEVK